MASRTGFSDPTKEQEGRRSARKDIMNRCQEKLSERAVGKKGGLDRCLLRKKMNTNKELSESNH